MALDPLPVDRLLPQILEQLGHHRNLVLEAPTGAGKTTRVPPALLGLAAGQVILVEPRRLAVRAAARRMAGEAGCQVGEQVGYVVRMDSRVSPKTRLVVMTPGVLLRRLLQDPFLEGVSTLVFDEFHERGLDSDLALCVARKVQREVRPDLRLVLMSATLDGSSLAAWLGDAARLVSEGRSFPVEVHYQALDRHARLEDAVTEGVLRMHDQIQGNVLVFLPGVGEIRRAETALADKARRRDVEVLTLYGEMKPEDQDRALQPGTRRRWILATNVAESSVTVHGVEAVVDSGWQRRMEQNAQTGLDHLVLARISQASADQRTGRAGRTAPGRCLRLWGAHEQVALLAHEPAEVARVDPAGALLWLLAFGERDPEAFPWLQPPPPQALAAGMQLLERLGAWQPGRGITALGRAMGDLPLHPRLARLLLAGVEFGVPDRAALAAMLCSERWPLEGMAEASEHHSDSDLLDAVEALEGLRDRGTLHAGTRTLRAGPARNLLQLAGRLVQVLPQRSNQTAPKDRDEALLRAIAVAFRDRLARRRENDPTRALMAGGRGVRIAPQSSVHDARLFVCVEVVQGRGDASARVLSRVEPEWLGAEAETEQEIVRFDPDRQAVAAFRVRYLDDLSLEEKPIPPTDWEAVAECLVAAARRDPARALPLDRPEVASFLERVRFLAHHQNDGSWPNLDEPALLDLLPDLALGCRSFEDLRKAPWLDHLRGLLSHEQNQRLAREAPTHIRLPKGRNVALVYDGSRAPILASRIQDFFGLNETPRVAGGKVPVLLHLLAPNGRPQQVTDDLASFWGNTYELVRRELRRRYPKHAWPEDPRQG
ncbi:MAG: ATP-dependent helicase HrpB [Planctomycetes bacterium]|nr:ATP-dependent helicase HrpB [Planctomycetota bacterium]MCB9909697.1 ATP-dependent helicase HrpB [Planctomycetota bacterium]MCB9911814.1 ATP-dependent helicase HrpB [Planctomycetota bacterium]